MNKQLLIITTILLLLPLSFAQLTMEQETYFLGEEVAIQTNTSGLQNPQLTITSDNKLFRFTGELQEQAVFLPRTTGNYTASLTELQTGELQSQKTFTVVLQETNESIPNVETIPDVHYEETSTQEETSNIEALSSNATTNRFITLHQEEYAPQENVPIIINYKTNFSLRILGPNSVFSLIDEPTRSILFRPQEQGLYEIQLYAQEGLVETKEFLVTTNPQTTKNLPFTNIQNNIRDSRGNPFESNRVRLHNQKGLPVQSNINAQERYRVTLLPQDAYVQNIVFDDVRFEQALDIGVETLAPQYNPAGEGTSMHAFALDPERVDFTTGTITVEAPGTQVYKCVEYNFTTQECHGEHELIMQTNPGELIEIPFDPIDPLYTFVDTTISCSCTQTQSPAANTGTVSCQTVCPVTVDGPGSSAITGFVEEVQFQTALTIDDDGATISNADHEGVFESDIVGTSTATASTGLTWILSGLPSSGTGSYTDDSCDNWPDDCSYEISLSTTFDFSRPGKSTGAPSGTISLDELSVTWNYTEAGDFSVTLEQPDNNDFVNNPTIAFDFLPATATTELTSCSLYTNETGWQAVNTSTSITNNNTNTLSHTFSSDGVYAWNVECEDDENEQEFAPNNRTITLDTTNPAVTLNDPIDETTLTESPIFFEYEVQDNSPVDSCSIYIDGSLEDTDTSITRGVPQEFALAQNSGSYEWYVQCIDLAGNTGQSPTRTYDLEVTPTIWEGLWYESSTFDCAATGSCELDLTQATDGTANSKSVSLAAGDSANMINATSPFLGGRGVFVPEDQTITLRASFIETTDGQGEYTWNLYALRSGGLQDLICSETETASTGFIEQTCSPANDFTFSGTDRLRLETTIQNNHPAQTRTYTHEWDVANSFVDFPEFYTIATLTTNLVEPTSAQTIAVNQQTDITCETTCESGYCLDTQASIQYRETPSGSWNTIGATGNLILAAGQDNPENIGDLFADPITSVNTTYTIEGNLVSDNEVRCRVTTPFDTITSNVQTITVGDDQPPEVSLVSPPDQTIHGTSPITVTYNVTNAGGLDSCTLALNGSDNQTNTNPTNNAENDFILSDLNEGLYNWTVTCLDDGQRQGNATNTWEFTIDTTPPAIQLNNPLDEEVIAINTVEFNWTMFDNNPTPGTCDVYIDGTLNQSSLTSTPGLANTTTVEGFAVGSYEWYMQCSDAAGNTNTSETRSFNITNIPPEVALITPQEDEYLPSNTVLFEYNASDNNEVLGCELYIDGFFNQTNQTPINQGGINTFSTSGLDEGLHNWTVSCFDEMFTTTPPEQNFTVDTVAPDVFLISPLNVDFATADIPLQFNYSDVTSPTGVCEVQYESTTHTNITSGVEAVSNEETELLATNVPDGTYSWNVSCLDLAGNPGMSTIDSFNVSVLPTITLESPAPNAITNGEEVNFSFTPADNDGFDSCTVKLITGPNVSNTTNQTPITNDELNTITLSNLEAGMHSWAVECIDAGVFSNSFQTNERLLFIDNEAPTIELNNPVDVEVNNANVTFNWTADDDQANTLSCDVYVNGALNESNIPSSAGEDTLFWVDGFNNGPHNWSVMCADDAGNTNTSATANFTVEVPPSVELRDPEDNQHFNFTQDFFFSYTPEANADLQYCDIYSNGQLIHNNPSPTIGEEQQIFTNLTQGEGTYSWNVLCEDVDGLTGEAPDNFTYVIDTTPPTINVTAPENNSVESFNNVTFNITPEDNLASNVTCDIFVDGFPEVSEETIPTGEPYITGILLSDGEYDWYATCSDIAGNVHTTDTYNFTVFAPPRVTQLEPDNNTFYNITDVTLTYLPEDGFPIVSCDLFVNNELNQTDSFIQTNQNNTFDLTSLAEGLYDWRVECLDQDSNTGSSNTSTFAIDLNPSTVTLFNPLNEELFTTPDVTFNFTATDEVSDTMTCDLRVNNNIESENISVANNTIYDEVVQGFPDGTNQWNVTCVDQALWSTTSSTRTFNVSIPPTVISNTPLNNTWTNLQEITFDFYAQDNDGIDFCELQLDGSTIQTNNTIINDANNTITNNTLVEGTYDWAVSCTDTGVFNNKFTTNNQTINIDRTPPNVTLISPFNGSEVPSDIVFNYTVTDNLAPTTQCDLFLNGQNINATTVTNNTFVTHEESVALGFYEWNVSCTDFATNTGFSDTWNFTVQLPDLAINEGNITFDQVLPVEGDNVTVFANIFNIGPGNADSFQVELYDGNPEQDGLLLDNITVNELLAGDNITLNTTFTTDIGSSNIFVLVDTPLETNGSVPELNEDNNKANRTLQVSLYEIFSGTTNDELRIDDSTLTSLFTWSVDNSTGGNLFVADADSIIDFTNLTALSRTTTGSYEQEHFETLDVKLNSTTFPDNINNTWSQEGQPVATRTFRVFGQDVTNVPIVNSTNTSAFQTGILWDASDGSVSYDGSQEVVFITQINQSQQGYSGTYDYEFRVPATLRDYIPGGNTVTFYAEIK